MSGQTYDCAFVNDDGTSFVQPVTWPPRDRIYRRGGWFIWADQRDEEGRPIYLRSRQEDGSEWWPAPNTGSIQP